MYVRNLAGEEFPAQLTRTVDSELNSNSILTATIQPTDINLAFLQDISEMWGLVDDEGTAFKLIYFKKKGLGHQMQIDLKAIPLFFDDMNVQRIYERYDQSFTAAAYFTLVFQDSGYQFQLHDSFDAQRFEGAGEGSTRLEMFKKGIERYKAEFELIGETVHLRTLIGNDTAFRYEYRLNASNIAQEVDANELWTYARGYGDYGDGDGGEDWQNAQLVREYTSPIAELIGRRDAPPIKNGNITTVETMDAQLQTLVDDSLKISVTADIHDLRKQGYPIAQVNLGDRTYLIDRRIEFDEQVRIVRKVETRSWKGELIGLSLTFGTPGIVRRYQSQLESSREAITDFLSGKTKLPFSSLDAAVQAATKALQSAQTELNFENGILAVDPDNPNFVTIFNSAGIGVSTNGGVTFDQAITGQGINTDLLTAGSINTGNISIIGENDFFYWDGNALEAINPNDVTKYVRLNSQGLYIAKGALTIERPDGYVVMNDGLLQNDFSLQPTNPEFRNKQTVDEQGVYWATSENSPQNCAAYFFAHKSRFLQVQCVLHDLGSGLGSRMSIDEIGGSLLGQATRYNLTDATATPFPVIISIDLGVPTGEQRGIYIRLNTNTGGQARGRIQKIWLEQ